MPAAALVGVLGVSVRMRRMERGVFAFLLLLFTARIGGIIWYWQPADDLAVEQRALLRQLPENTRLFSLVFMPEDRLGWKTVQPLVHLAGYATIDRHAIAGNAFAVRGQQPLARRIPMWFRYTRAGDTVADFNWDRISADYDHIWVYGVPPDFADYLGRHYALAAHSGNGDIYRIRP